MKIDMMAFLLSQEELMTRRVEKADLPKINLDACHLTVAPPSPKTTCASVIEATNWLDEQFEPGYYRGALLYGLQHPPIDFTPQRIGELRDALGIKFCTIAYELENQFGGGFAAPKTGLTIEGEELLDAMAEVGMVLDLSHASHLTARGAIHHARRRIANRDSKLRIVATHTGCYSVYDHPRNLPDDVLVDIAQSGGIVGVYTLTFGLHKTDNSLNPFMDHVRHAVNLLGPDAVAIGSDGVYRSISSEKQQAIFEMMSKEFDPRGNFRSRFPDQAPILNSPRRMDIIADILSSEFPSTVVDGLTGGNAYRFLTEADLLYRSE